MAKYSALLLCFFAILGASSCTEKAVEKVPSDMLPVETFSKLVADFALQEAKIGQLTQLDSLSIARMNLLSTQILAKHNISKEEFERNLHYYQTHKELFLQVYDSALVRLNKQLDSARAVLKDSLKLQ